MEKILVDLLRQRCTTIPNLLLEHYKELGILDEEVFLLIHILSFKSEGINFPTAAELEQRMSTDIKKIFKMVHRLVWNGFLSIEEREDDSGVRHEYYDLTPLYKKLVNILIENHGILQQPLETDLYTLFENEFGRPLSPMECETITLWQDQDGYSRELIVSALREAVYSGKVTIKYIDRILLEWQKNGIKTAEEAKNYSMKFREKQVIKIKKEPQTEDIPFTFYNWLEN
ncbi:DnaD domain-containing protein [Microaerobacter geothermalis]|uniref:DnaD domain-containing protein n=1 Tax=Microaerobacter geothermalis TaxID=674972 RepID=UPI001F29D37F|nr:DnaD domain-containing protein [Microaerobacter geothermalis]MCF6093331.1 DnaD domain-containing protein [Microaerobacter geothermalis]